MTIPAAAEVGMPLSQVDTPCLMLELDAFERNLRRLPDSLKGRDVRLRPHAKSHKSADIALRQIALGAAGVCVQKVSEAAALIEAGVKDILIANEVVGAPKLELLAGLNRRAHVAVCADDAGNVSALDAAARAAGVSLDVLVEVDVGANRCGVQPGGPAVALAAQISRASNLRFAGLQAYQGSAQHIRSVHARQEAITRAVDYVRHQAEQTSQFWQQKQLVLLKEAGRSVLKEEVRSTVDQLLSSLDQLISSLERTSTRLKRRDSVLLHVANTAASVAATACVAAFLITRLDAETAASLRPPASVESPCPAPAVAPPERARVRK